MSDSALFSFGYWGWGSRTDRLVEAMDTVETTRGNRPPLFVDIRLQRSVRAVGFNGSAFEKRVGKERCLWMPRLGNESIRTGADTIVIADPAAAGELLDLALARHRQRRSVVFFCACEWPAACRRGVVADLLRAQRKRRRVSCTIVEWPGGEPRELELPIAAAAFKKLRAGAKSIPLPADFPLAESCGLAWGSIVRCVAGDQSLRAIVGPARHSPAGWVLPVLETSESSLPIARQRARKIRDERGLLAR
jgi:hypothetical protein